MSLAPPTTFDSDPLELGDFCKRLEDYLFIDHDYVSESLVVSLNAPFGRGKSTFLKMWENDLTKRRKEEEANSPESCSVPHVINLSAWESDYTADPLLVIVSTILEAISEKQDENNEKHEKLTNSIKDVLWFGLGVADAVTGEIASKAANLAEKKQQERETAELKTKLLKSFQQRRYSLWNLKNALKAYFGAEKPKLFIFVDELDRCRPDYAVSYLETIKHVFDTKGIVFVLAIDYDHLANSARALYGSKLDFAEYFRKFVHRSFELPYLTEESGGRLIVELANTYIAGAENRKTKIQLHSAGTSLTKLLVGLRLSPRQCVDVFRVVGHVAAAKYPAAEPFSFGYSLGLFLMSALKAADIKMYHTVGEAPKWGELQDFLIKKMGKAGARDWVLHYMIGIGMEASILQQAALNVMPQPHDYVDGESHLGPLRNMWGDSAFGGGNQMRQIYRSIEYVEISIL